MVLVLIQKIYDCYMVFTKVLLPKISRKCRLHMLKLNFFMQMEQDNDLQLLT